MAGLRARIRSVRGLPWGLLGMLALVAGVESRAARDRLDFDGDIAHCWRYSYDQATRGAVGADVLFFGSSQTKLGVHVPTFERASGLKGFNLAVFNGRMPSTYYLLRRALAAGARPRAVVVDSIEGPRPPSVAEEVGLHRRSWPEILSPRECAELAWVGGGADFLARALLDQALPTLRARHEVRDWVTNSLTGRTAGPRQDWLVLQRNWERNRGSQLIPEGYGHFWGPPDPADARRVDELPGGNPLLNVYARRLLELTAAHGIAVFWHMPPTDPALQAYYRANGYGPFITRHARGLVQRYPHVVAVEGRWSGYGPELFERLIHLDSAGTACYSADLARLVARRLAGEAGPRWVDVPRYRRSRINPAAEDIDRSRAAVAAATSGRGRF